MSVCGGGVSTPDRVPGRYVVNAYLPSFFKVTVSRRTSVGDGLGAFIER